MSQTAPYQPPPLVPDELLQAGLTAAQKLVWITVRKVQGQNPVAWGSVAYYVERSGVSKRSVINALAVLEQQGWIRRDGREIQCLNPLAGGAENAPNGAKPAPEESAKSAPPGAKTARQSAKSAPPSESKQESKQRIQTHPPNPHGGHGESAPSSAGEQEQVSQAQLGLDSSDGQVTRGERAPPAEKPLDRWSEFWHEYPRKAAKKAASKRWRSMRLHLDPGRAARIIADVQRRREQDEQWRRGIIPHPATYLNGERWEDEIQTPRAPAADTGWTNRQSTERDPRDDPQGSYNHFKDVLRSN